MANWGLVKAQTLVVPNLSQKPECSSGVFRRCVTLLLGTCESTSSITYREWTKIRVRSLQNSNLVNQQVNSLRLVTGAEITQKTAASAKHW